jgi:hypothetical protein
VAGLGRCTGFGTAFRATFAFATLAVAFAVGAAAGLARTTGAGVGTTRDATGARWTGRGTVLATGGRSGATATGGGSGAGVAASDVAAKTRHRKAKAPVGAHDRRSDDRTNGVAILTSLSPRFRSKLLRFPFPVNESESPA